MRIADIKPVWKRVESTSSPLALYEELYRQEAFSFIYESLESVGKRGRYSFVGGKPFVILKSRGEDIEITLMNETTVKKGNPLEILKKLVNGYESCPQVSPFSGGALGYLAYDVVRFFEKIPDENSDELNTPDAFFIFPGEIIVFDHREKIVDIVVYSKQDSRERLEDLIERVKGGSKENVFSGIWRPEKTLVLESNFTEDSFVAVVEKAKQYILDGDVFQVVLSQRFSFPVDTDPFSVYRALRITNPSPYMYFLNFDGLHILGSSPEILVKLTSGMVTSRPLAGTRPRGRTRKEDKLLERELLSDEKERAEHVMLVDLARNDVGQVCEDGSIRVPHLLEIERYSKVMHLVSDVTGRLKKDKDAFDLIASTFPAGTVSGAPKIRAMEIIDELERLRRGLYAGAIGYFSFSGDMDFCIAIRMILIQNRMGTIQAGAGIVADSEPRREYQETLSKAGALIRAIEMAG